MNYLFKNHVCYNTITLTHGICKQNNLSESKGDSTEGTLYPKNSES